MRGITVAAALCFAAACGTDPAVAPPSEQAIPVGGGGPALASTSCQPKRASDGIPTPHLNCLQVVPVLSSNTDIIRPKIQAAVNIWNSVLAQQGLPKFATTNTATGSLTVNIKFDGSIGTWYCGTTNGSTGEMIIHRSSSSTTCNGNFTNAVELPDLSYLIAHELAHVIGFKHLSLVGSVPAADHCVASLPASRRANKSLCQAEIELLRYTYGLRDAHPDYTKHFATGFESVSGDNSLDKGQIATFSVGTVQFFRAAPFTHPAPSTLSYSWRSDNPAVAKVGTSTGWTNTVEGVAGGTTTVHIVLTSAAYERAVPFAGGDITVTVVVPPTQPPPPTSLSAADVTHSSATIGWVNGAADAGTTVEYRRSSTTTWTAKSVPAGVTTTVLAGLTALTTYDVRVSHVRNGLNSTYTTKTSLFKTQAVPPPPAITNFHVGNCERRPVGTKTYGYYIMVWTSNPAAGGYSFQIAEGTTSSSAGAALILTAPLDARSAEVGGYLVRTGTPTNRWFWLRYVGNGVTGAWTALVDNPLAVNTCLQY